MIEKLQIQNFRCFKNASIEGLKRINIIVGDNASGKTVLLESIKVGLDGLPQNFVWLNQLRTISTILSVNPTLEQFQSLFIDFFHLFESREKIIISIENSQHKTAEVRIHFDPSKTTTTQPKIGFQPDLIAQAAPPTTIIPLAFDRHNFQGKKDTLLVTVNPKGELLIETGKAMGPVSGLVSTAYYGGPGENARWLSQLRIEKQSEEVDRAIKRHFSFISDLSPETPSAGSGTVYADLESLPRKIPLSLVSSGISRLLTMVLAIIQYKKGVVLIDEIENGIYFEQYPKVWETLVDLAKHHETQLFITTHSLECFRGLLSCIKDNEDDFLLLRVEKENGSSKITPIEGKFIEAAIEQGFDVR